MPFILVEQTSSNEPFFYVEFHSMQVNEIKGAGPLNPRLFQIKLETWRS